MITRILCTVVNAVSLVLALACANLWFQESVVLALLAGAAAVAAITIARRLSRRDDGIAFHASAIGACLGLAASVYLLPYRAPAQVVLAGVYFAASVAGAYAGSYVPILRSRGVLTINDR